jgi:hypothetical protein
MGADLLGNRKFESICLVTQGTPAKTFNLPLAAYPRVMRVYDTCMAIPAFADAHRLRFFSRARVRLKNQTQIADHIKPLACGGPDAVSNLQWQTIRDARAKDRWERRACVR